MKKVFFLLSVFLLFSCSEVDNKVAKLELTSSKDERVFTLDSSNVVNITAASYNEAGKELDQEISWTLKSDEGEDLSSSLVSLSKNQVSIQPSNINRLGDYTLTAKAQDKESVYSFSLETTEKLDANLVWSLIPVSSITSKQDGSGFSISDEYDSLGEKITKEEDKAIVGNSLVYTPNSSNFLHISLKDKVAKSFGKLEIEIVGDEGTYSQLDNGLLISSSSVENQKTISYKIKAGNKQDKSVSIILKPYEETMTPVSVPAVGGLSNSSKAGKYFSILGQGISTEYEKKDDYLLEITAKRKYIGQEGDYRDYRTFLKESTSSQVPDEWASDTNNADECVILTPTTNGYFVWMKYAGDYKILYTLIDKKTGISLYQGSYEVSIPFLKGTLQVEKLANENRKSDFLSTEQEIFSLVDKRQNLYKYDIAASVSSPVDVYTDFTPNDPGVSLDAKEFSKESFTSSSTVYLSYAGTYNFVAVYQGKGNGYGNLPLSKDEIEYYLNKGMIEKTEDYVIENASDYDAIDWSKIVSEKIERQIDTDGKFYTTYLFDFTNVPSLVNSQIYAKLYKNKDGKFIEQTTSGITLSGFNSIPNRATYTDWQGAIQSIPSGSSKFAVRLCSSDLEEMSVFFYVRSSNLQKYESVSSCSAEPTISMSSSASVSFTTIPDSQQTGEGKKEIYINNLKDHTLYYKWGSGSWQSTTSSQIKVSTSYSQTLYAYAIHLSSGTRTSTISRYVSLSYPCSMSVSAKKDSEQTTYNQREYKITCTPSTNEEINIYRGTELVKTISANNKGTSASFDASYTEDSISYFTVKVKGYATYNSSSMSISTIPNAYWQFRSYETHPCDWFHGTDIKLVSCSLQGFRGKSWHEYYWDGNHNQNKTGEWQTEQGDWKNNTQTTSRQYCEGSLDATGTFQAYGYKDTTKSIYVNRCRTGWGGTNHYYENTYN